MGGMTISQWRGAVLRYYCAATMFSTNLFVPMGGAISVAVVRDGH